MLKEHEDIIRIFNRHITLNEAEANALVSSWTRKTSLNRNDYLIRKDEVETNLFYVISGAMRIYFPHDDEEICVGFAYENSLICSYPSFIQKKPSQYFIQALSKTEVISISQKSFYNLFDQYKTIERSWRMIEEEALLGKIEREVEMLTYTPEERLQRLLQRSPHLFQIIPKKYIASYLRMKPETLSRILLK